MEDNCECGTSLDGTFLFLSSREKSTRRSHTSFRTTLDVGIFYILGRTLVVAQGLAVDSTFPYCGDGGKVEIKKRRIDPRRTVEFDEPGALAARDKARYDHNIYMLKAFGPVPWATLGRFKAGPIWNGWMNCIVERRQRLSQACLVLDHYSC
jgi:hypothetical protein